MVDRRQFLKHAAGVAAAPFALSAMGEDRPIAPVAECEDVDRIEKPLSEWRRLLTEDEYAILFEEETEPRWSSPLVENEREGTYICAACHQPLFKSKTKFHSGTGWPSFYAPIPCSVGTKKDRTLLFIVRTEYHCSRCGGHQGHVFEWSTPTGKRYCNNGLALDFVPEGEPLPELRG